MNVNEQERLSNITLPGIGLVGLMMFNATFNNISVRSWRYTSRDKLL